MDTQELADQQIHQLGADTRCHLEDLPEVIDDRDKESKDFVLSA